MQILGLAPASPRMYRYRTVKMLVYPKIFGNSDTSQFFYFTDHNTNSFATNYNDITSITQPQGGKGGEEGNNLNVVLRR